MIEMGEDQQQSGQGSGKEIEQGTDEGPLAVVELFRPKRRRRILLFFVTVAKRDEIVGRDRQWHFRSDVRRHTDISRESIRLEVAASSKRLLLFELGLLEINDRDVPRRKYRLTDTKPAVLLRKHATLLPTVIALFRSDAARDIAEFFLAEFDFEQSFSPYHIHNNGPGTGYDAMEEHLPTLVKNNLLATVDGKRTTEYRLADSQITRFIHDLNSALASEYLKPNPP